MTITGDNLLVNAFLILGCIWFAFDTIYGIYLWLNDDRESQ